VFIAHSQQLSPKEQSNLRKSNLSEELNHTSQFAANVSITPIEMQQKYFGMLIN
jgi:hypothetical protein